MKAIIEHIQPLEWSPGTGRYTTGSNLKIGRVTVAQTSRAIGSKSDGPDVPLWKAFIMLPGIKLVNKSTGSELRFMTEDEAKAAAERAVLTWFDWIAK